MPRKEGIDGEAFQLDMQGFSMPVPLPVNVMGGEVAILAGAEVPAIWSGPHGYSPNNDRQITLTDPGHKWVDGYPGTLAADRDLVNPGDRKLFLTEFPTARPGWLYGIVYVSWGSGYAYLCDMYNASDTSTKEYKDRQEWAYDSGSFCRKRLFEPKSGQGMWDISFAKPIPFYLGLRVSYDNGSSNIYCLYALDPAFA